MILNGAGSTGKSSLASEFHDLRAARGEFWFRAGIDDVLAKVTFPWLDIGWPAGPGAHPTKGCGSSRHPMATSWTSGRSCRELLHTYQDGAAMNAGAASTCSWTRPVSTPRSTPAGARCSPTSTCSGSPCAALPRRWRVREAARGDRPIGLAAALANTVHRGIAYDGEIDTTARSPRDLAVELDELVQRISTT